MCSQKRAKARQQMKRNVEVKNARIGRSERAWAEASTQLSDEFTAFEVRLTGITYAAQGEPRDAQDDDATEGVTLGDAAARTEAMPRQVKALRTCTHEKEKRRCVAEEAPAALRCGARRSPVKTPPCPPPLPSSSSFPT
jgi:hypothetical protein